MRARLNTKDGVVMHYCRLYMFLTVNIILAQWNWHKKLQYQFHHDITVLFFLQVNPRLLTLLHVNVMIQIMWENLVIFQWSHAIAGSRVRIWAIAPLMMILFMAIFANACKDLMVPIVNLITVPVNSTLVCRKVLVYLVALSLHFPK